MTERQRILAEKLAVNRSRQMRDAYLALLPEGIRSELTAAPVRFQPDNAHILRHWFVSSTGVGREEPSIPPGYAFQEFGCREKMLTAAVGHSSRHDGQSAHLQPFNVRHPLAAGLSMKDCLVGELPVFDIEFGWARQKLPQLFEASGFGLGLVTSSFEAGIVICAVCGHHDEDPNPDEIVYELGLWG